MGRHFDIAEIKAALPLSTLIGVTVGWDRRKTNAHRGDFWAPCPFHQERTPSFHVDDRKGFYYCFGCSASGDHVSWCQQFHGDDFHQAVARLAEIAGIAPADPARPARPARAPAPPVPCDDRQAALNRLRMAADIWRASHPTSPLLMKYLRARGVLTRALERTWDGPPPCIRLHPNLAHWAGGEVIHRGPAMICLITRPPGQGTRSGIVGIHRTWITAQGRAEAGGRKLAKKWRGLTGHMHGAPAYFTPASERMIVGEGIETTLVAWSRRQLDWLDGRGEYWSAQAALSLGALTGRADPAFRGPPDPVTGRRISSAVPDMAAFAWRAPDLVDHLVILGEGSAANPAEARARGTCAQRRHVWRSDGTARRCDLLLPPGGWASGDDFADLAVRGAA